MEEAIAAMEGFNLEDTPVPSTTKSQLWGDTADPKCETCGKVFKRRSELNRHKNIHIGPSYRCHFPQCKKQFTQKQTLVIHLESTPARSLMHATSAANKWQIPAPLRSIEGAILEQSHTHAPIRLAKSVSQGRQASRCIYEHNTNARNLMFERLERLRLQRSLTSQRQCPLESSLLKMTSSSLTELCYKHENMVMLLWRTACHM
jgi:hypothetical protein